MKDTFRINEIFYSLQGEGRWTGTPAIFVRFSGCNLHCSFCDTRHDGFTELNVDEIVNAVAEYDAPMVVLTGGEPSLQVTEQLLDALHKAGKRIHMETNGSVNLACEVLAKLDWITLSPKDAPLKIGRFEELKLLYRGRDKEDEIAMFETEAIAPSHSDCRYLQPCDTGDSRLNVRIVADAIEYIKAHPCWKLSLQTHKLLDIR